MSGRRAGPLSEHTGGRDCRSRPPESTSLAIKEGAAPEPTGRLVLRRAIRADELVARVDRGLRPDISTSTVGLGGFTR